MTETFYDLFMTEYYQKLLTPAAGNPVRNRADSLKVVFEELGNKIDKTYNVLETGCMRGDHGSYCFGDDGCATHIFDVFVNFYNGHLYSVDINPNNVEYSRARVSERTTVTCSDSVPYLYSLPKDLKFDLIYLDSYDIERDNPHPHNCGL